MIVIEGAHVVTCDAAGSEWPDAHVVVEGNRIAAVGAGPAPDHLRSQATTRVDARGRLVTPGLVNSHSHLFQWITRGLATDHTLFEWLGVLYPVWAVLDEQLTEASAAANLAWLALTGCTTSMDHHYVFPRGGGDLLAAEIRAARTVGMRFNPARGSMNLGESDGGLPPDNAVETHEAILTASQQAIDDWHDPSFGSMLRIALAPCSPFTVTEDLMRESAALARSNGVRLHTHLAETADEHAFCLERFGRTPVQYADDVDWLAPDVWFAHGVHFDDDAIARLGASRTGVAHCPSSNGRLGAGIARTRDLLAAGSPVGLGVDGAASNESGRMSDEIRQALLLARATGGPLAMSVRDSLMMATMGGARCLGREDEIGSLEPGKLADVALWRLDGLPGEGVADPVAALGLGAAPLDRLIIDGRDIVVGAVLVSADAGELAAAAGVAGARIRAALGGRPASARWT